MNQVLVLLALGHLKERGLSDVQPALINQGSHVTEKERQQERTDVRSVHISVSHDDRLAVADFFRVQIP